MSPEQLMGQRGDIRSDIFSVGALLYRVLTGERPFDGESTATIMKRVVGQEAVSPKNINPHIPVVLEKISARAMAKDPSQRYQTPGEMLADLEAFEPLGTVVAVSAPPEEGTAVATRAERIPPAPEFLGTEKLTPVLPAGEEFATVAVPAMESPRLDQKDPADQAPPIPEPAPDAESAKPPRGLKALLAGLFLLLLLLAGSLLLFRWNPAPVPLTTPSGSPAGPPTPSTTPIPTQAPTLPATPVNPPTAKTPAAPPPPPAPATPPAPAPAATTEQLLQQAAVLWNTNLDQARSLLERAVAQSPNNFEAHYQLARLLTQKRRFPAAIQEYQQALNLNNRVPEIYFNLGYIHLAQGNYDLAIQHLEWCRALNPPYQDEVLTNIGIVYLRKKNLSQARLYLNEAIALNPRNSLARDYLKGLESTDKDHKKKERHD
jgi:serine/threonine-protein kinase